MKPAPFEYAAPASLAEALALKAEHGDEAKFLAGGQSLVPAMNFRLVQAALLVDLNDLADLSDIHLQPDGELRLGAMVRQRRLERDPLIARHAPLLHAAMPVVAHPQIRNRGTLGGSLAHADPAAELPVVALALAARLRLQSSRGERWVAASEFFLDLFTTALAPDEMLVEAALPPLPPRTMICPRPRSRSWTRSPQHSVTRSPQPYNSRAISRNRPSAPRTCPKTSRTSSGVSTTGRRLPRRARTASSVPRSISST